MRSGREIMPGDPKYEFYCPKCPGSLWAHDDDLERLERLVIFHFNDSPHPQKLTKQEARDLIRERIHVPPPVSRLEKPIAG